MQHSQFIFFGTPRFAEIVLEELLRAGMAPAAVVCNPDRPVGRKQVITAPPVKELATSRGILVLQPEMIDENFMKELRELAPDFAVVAAYAKILPKAILDVPRLGTIGVHPSLLPKYRGASPIQSAILAGEHETGATLYLVDEKMDHGPILAARGISNLQFPIFEYSYRDLEEKLARLGGELLAETVPKFLAGKIVPHAQDESQATHTKKFKTEDAFIEEGLLAAAERGDAKAAEEILRKINAFNPEPGAWTIRDGKRIKLLRASIKDGALKLLETR